MLRRFSVNFAIFSMILDFCTVLIGLSLAEKIRPLLNSLPMVKALPATFRMPSPLYLVFPLVFLVILATTAIYDGRKYLRVVDEYIPEPVREVDKPFMMPVEDVFSIKGRGTVVTGRIDRGLVKVGDPVEIVGLREKSMSSVCTGVEMFHKLLDEGMAGDNVGLLLRGIERTDVERGQVVAKPGSITPHKKFLAEVYVLKKEEGGRHKAFFTGYRPQFYIRTMDVTGNIELPAGVEMVMPGDNVNLTVELIVPVALEQGSKFAIREGGLTVGAGVITKIIA